MDSRQRSNFPRNRSCQTLYREADAQTAPWFPPYKTNESKTPEVVTFASLPFEDTCFDKHDIEIVQRNRAFVEWEKYLSSIPPENAELRKTIIMKIEQDKWNFREKELDEENKRRLEQARRELEEQRAIVQERIKWRSKNTLERHEQRKTTTLPKIKSRLERDLRRINFIKNKPQYPQNTLSKEVMDQYYNSDLTLPPARFGKTPKRSYEILHKEAYPSTMKDAYLMLESALNPMKEKSVLSRKKSITKHDCEKHIKAHQLVEKTKKPLEVKRVIEKNKPNLETLESLLEDKAKDHEFQRDIKLIQCLIRGRAVQNMMIRQYKANLELLNELDLSVTLDKKASEVLWKEKREAATAIRDYFVSMKMKDKIQSVIGRLKGHTISAALDFSAKELMRLEEERRLNVLAETAEKDRWAREAIEAGRRQEEEQRQRQHEEMYKEVMKTHEISSDVLMGEILQDQIDDTGKGLATIMTRKVADVYDKVIPKPCPDAYKKLEYVSLLTDRCLLTKFENERLMQQQNQKEVEFQKRALNVLTEIKRDLDKHCSTESDKSFESEEDERKGKDGKLVCNDSQEKEEDENVVNLTVEEDDSSEIIIKDYELDNMDENSVRKFLEYAKRKESSISDNLSEAERLLQKQKEIEVESFGNQIQLETKKERDKDYNPENDEIVDSENEQKKENGSKVEFSDTTREGEGEHGESAVKKDEIIKDSDLNETDKNVVKKLLEYAISKESSESEIEDVDTALCIAAGDKKAIRKHLFKKEKELLKKFVDKPSLLFQKNKNSDLSDYTDTETDTSADMKNERKTQQKTSKPILETEEAFQKRCLEKKCERILNEILTRAESYIEKYQTDSKKDGYTLETLQRSFAETMTEAYRILSIELLKSSDRKSKKSLEKNIKPWVNVILNEATKRVRNVFASLVVEESEVEEEILEDIEKEEEEFIKPEEVDQMIIELATIESVLPHVEDVTGHHIFDNKNYYWCPEEEKDSESAEEVETETESDLDDDKPIRYLGVLDEKATEFLIPDDRNVNKLPSVIKARPLKPNKH